MFMILWDFYRNKDNFIQHKENFINLIYAIKL